MIKTPLESNKTKSLLISTMVQSMYLFKKKKHFRTLINQIYTIIPNFKLLFLLHTQGKSVISFQYTTELY